MASKVSKRDADDFRQAIDDITVALDNAKRIAARLDKADYERARAYWIAQIEGAIDFGNGGCDMEETANALDAAAEDEENEEEE